jgi:hypothetical protein
MRADPNIVDSKLDMTIFERVLMTPDSSEFIQACIDSGVDLHAVKFLNIFIILNLHQSHEI